MNLEGRKIILNKPVAELVELLKDPQQYEQLMPDGLQKFEAIADGFKFSLKGMPEIALKVGEVNENKAILRSASSSLDFELTTAMNAVSENQTEIQMFFEGKFNPFIKMMVEKPLQNFMNALTDKIEKRYA
ncbi:SRPBCC family protein [Chryseobacterium lacus]|uniref:SRPBCC family protein n=1 Tax=Chryseobacterium lacus TaxID=2058346 RepID=A0A368N6B6_9FLAO|nr:SRPBCC family protein [Chryseobacterium lacus]RCU44809.1 SRPBCC family protein [Chryseobacterium lacus]RST32474.1 SRPBCC family protein [Chryseobacterium lacus]